VRVYSDGRTNDVRVGPLGYLVFVLAPLVAVFGSFTLFVLGLTWFFVVAPILFLVRLLRAIVSALFQPRRTP
jgi:hypothetical protein